MLDVTISFKGSEIVISGEFGLVCPSPPLVPSLMVSSDGGKQQGSVTMSGSARCNCHGAISDKLFCGGSN